MRRFTVGMTATASATVEVVLDDERLAEVAANLGVEVDALTAGDLREAAEDEAYRRGVPVICAQCSGWNQPWRLDIGEWQTDEDETVNGTTFHAVEEVTG